MVKLTKNNIRYLTRTDLWNDDDIQVAIDYLNSNEDEFKKFLLDLDNYFSWQTNDRGAIVYCISSARTAESFYRFDSDVAEEFIDIFKKSILNNL